MTQQLLLEGQKVVYNPETKIAKTTIKEPFISAGKKLHWEFTSPGIGLNLHLIEFVLKTKCTLIVFVESADHDYWLKNDVLLQFLKDHETNYKIRNTVLKIIPWELFNRFNPSVET